jgi:hypothetical protein
MSCTIIGLYQRFGGTSYIYLLGKEAEEAAEDRVNHVPLKYWFCSATLLGVTWRKTVIYTKATVHTTTYAENMGVLSG